MAFLHLIADRFELSANVFVYLILIVLADNGLVCGYLDNVKRINLTELVLLSHCSTGTDIKLGGNAEYLAIAEMKRLGYEESVIQEATGFADVKIHGFHEALNPVTAEQSHKVVFKRDIEAALTGVTLTTGAPAQLVVDTAA